MKALELVSNELLLTLLIRDNRLISMNKDYNLGIRSAVVFLFVLLFQYLINLL